MTTLRAMPVLQVSDVTASAAFYERLGFHSHGIWHHEGTAKFAILQRGDVTLAVQLLRGPLRVNTHWAAYIYVSDVAALHDEWAGLDLPELTAIRHDNPYECDEFDIRDPDGHLICFGQDMIPTHGPGLSDKKGRG
ncbi:MAG: VOC family protein [Pseudomonadota bacterium]